MDIDSYFRYVLALLFVLGLILAASYAARRFGLGVAIAPRARGQAKRLGVLEVATLDSRRRLVLVRRDGVEHLLLLGHNGETLVETGIDSTKTDVPA